MNAFEENEISKKAFGGTELTKRLLSAHVPEDLQQHFQIIPSRVRDLYEDKIRIYWIHDLPEDGEISHLKFQASRNRFHKIVFNSSWQLNDAVSKLGIPQDDKLAMINIPIEPIKHIKKPTDKINLIYLSTPQRGLQILVPVFDALAKNYPNIHLDVYSSFKIYGWESEDAKFEELYDLIRQHPQMTYHGHAHHDDIVVALQKAHIFAYPCIWPETACRTLTEAMSAGLLCVHPNYTSLSDLSGQLTMSYQFMDSIDKHANVFYHTLNEAIKMVSNEDVQEYLQRVVKPYADLRFNVDNLARSWQNLLVNTLQMYQSVESRAIKRDMFTYKS
jgi:UDP-glucose:(glucosyl)LPS alpha-1,2-glucosyltransferase